VLRRVFNWPEHIKPEIFSGLGAFLGVITLFYLYLVFAEQLTMRYAAPLSELLISDKLFQGEFAPVFWPMLILGFLIPPVMLMIQAIRPKWFSLNRTVLAAALILMAFLVKRFLIVVPSLLRPLLPFPEGSYIPSWVEWSMMAGVFAIAILLYTVFLKLFPIVELGEE
jgi:molybdopterin-containing oxidoreductase family membrane subunit